MSTKKQFLEMLKEKGATREQAAKAFKMKLEQGSPFDEEPVDTIEVLESGEDLGAGFPETPERSTISKAIAPTAGADVHIPDSPVLEGAAKVGTTALEVMDFPKRALGALRGGDITDPKTALFAKEAEPFENIDLAISNLEKKLSALPKEDDDGAITSMLGSFIRGGASKKELIENVLEDLQKRKDSGKGMNAANIVVAEFMKEAPTAFVGSLGSAAKKTIKWLGAGKFVMAERLGENVSKLSEDAFRFLRTKGAEGRKTLEQAQGKAFELGNEIRDIVFNKPEKFFPETKVINDIVEKMPNIPIGPTVKKLRELESQVVGRSDIAVEVRNVITKQINHLENATKSTGPELFDASGRVIPKKITKDVEISAKAFKQTREDLDAFVGNFDQVPPDLKKRMKSIYKSVGAQMRADLVKHAPKEFKEDMKSWHNKLSAIDELKFKFGTNGESFIGSAFGKNKSQRQAALDGIEKAFEKEGFKIKNRAKLTSLADELETRDFTTKLRAPRRVGENFTSVSGLLGSVIPPSTAFKVVNTLEAAGKGLSKVDKLSELGIDAAQYSALLNMMKGIAENAPGPGPVTEPPGL